MSDLGHLVWFTIPDSVRITLVEARTQWEDLGLDTGLLPRVLLPIHAFRHAASTTKLDYTDDTTGELIQLAAVKIRQSLDFHEQHVMRTARRKRSTTSVKLIELKFFQGMRTAHGRRHGGHRIKHLVSAAQPWTEQDRHMAGQWMDTFHAEYEAACTDLRQRNIQLAIRQQLEAAGDLIDQRRGIYFVDVVHSTPRHLAEFVESLGGGCFMEVIPLEDTPQNKDIVTRALNRTTRKEL